MGRPSAPHTWLSTLVFVLVVVLHCRDAYAEPALDLTWSAPAGCPDRAWMESAVLHLVTAAPPQTLRVTGTVREESGRFVVDLELEGAATGRRTLSAASCTSVSRGAALIVALALDPQAALASDDLARSERPLPPPPPVIPPQPSPAPPSPTPARHESSSNVRPILFAGASIERALLPGVAPGALVGGGIVWRALRVDLAAELAPSASTTLVVRPEVGADFALAGLALRGCVGHVSSWIALQGCGGFRGVRLSGEGTGLAEAYRQTAHLVVLEPGALVRVPGNTRAAVELDGAAVLPFTRPDFVILSAQGQGPSPSEPLFRVSAFGLRLALAASFRF